MEITKTPQPHYQRKPEVAIPTGGIWDPMRILESNFPNTKDFEETLLGIDGVSAIVGNARASLFTNSTSLSRFGTASLWGP